MLKQQTFTSNNITVSFPVGYASVHNYIAVLKLNLKSMQSNPKKWASIIPKTEQALAQALAATK